MTRPDFLSVLQEFADGSNIELAPAGEKAFELKFRKDPTNRRVFIQPELTANGENVGELLFRCLCGAIEDARALPTILNKNFGGVMGTEFYFSARQIDKFYYLFLETRLRLDADSDDREEIIFLLSSLWMSPLFMNEWNFPPGVENFLW